MTSYYKLTAVYILRIYFNLPIWTSKPILTYLNEKKTLAQITYTAQ